LKQTSFPFDIPQPPVQLNELYSSQLNSSSTDINPHSHQHEHEQKHHDESIHSSPTSTKSNKKKLSGHDVSNKTVIELITSMELILSSLNDTITNLERQGMMKDRKTRIQWNRRIQSQTSRIEDIDDSKHRNKYKERELLFERWNLERLM